MPTYQEGVQANGRTFISRPQEIIALECFLWPQLKAGFPGLLLSRFSLWGQEPRTHTRTEPLPSAAGIRAWLLLPRGLPFGWQDVWQLLWLHPVATLELWQPRHLHTSPNASGQNHAPSHQVRTTAAEAPANWAKRPH